MGWLLSNQGFVTKMTKVENFLFVDEVPKGCLMELTNANFEVHVNLAKHIDA